MPKLNVGASRKVFDQNENSREASVSLEVDIDANVASEPAKLQDRIRKLFGLLRSSLTEQMNGSNPSTASQNGLPNNSNGSSSSRLATQSQIKAILAIARNRRINVGQLLNERFQVSRPDDLTIKQASSIIDELKNNADPRR